MNITEKKLIKSKIYPNICEIVKKNINYSCMLDVFAYGFGLLIVHKSHHNKAKAEKITLNFLKDLRKISLEYLKEPHLELELYKNFNLDCTKNTCNQCKIEETIEDFKNVLKNNICDRYFEKIILYGILVILLNRAKADIDAEKKMLSMLNGIEALLYEIIIVLFQDNSQKS